tara:strand:- start:20336 stop:21379 length:1044 start_codon:yes stop_codon:yes gene_type:complete
MKKIKIAFISKRATGDYGTTSLQIASDFLARYITQTSHYAEAEAFTAIDANCIDKIVSDYEADVIIIEALWVTPDKMKELICIHGERKWIVRVHSRFEFLAQDGIALDWLLTYDPNVKIAFNNRKAANTFDTFQRAKSPYLGHSKVLWLPNIYYPNKLRCDLQDNLFPYSPWLDDGIKIGIFGAHRELKNTLNQVMAAINYGDALGKNTTIYVNDVGDPEIIKNLKAINEHTGVCSQIEFVDWMTHDEFLNFVMHMDVGLQVSFSESYNIVAFDFIYCDKPILTSTFMECTNKGSRSLPDERSIRKGIARVLRFRGIRAWLNRRKLARVNKIGTYQWNKVMSTAFNA